MCGHGDTGACFSVSRCFLKLGEWQLNLQGINESTIPKVLQYYSAATEHDRGWYKVTVARAVSQPRLLRGRARLPASRALALYGRASWCRSDSGHLLVGLPEAPYELNRYRKIDRIFYLRDTLLHRYYVCGSGE